MSGNADSLPKIEALALGRWSTWNTEISAWLPIKGWYSVVSGALPRPTAPAPGETPSTAYKEWLDIDSRAAGALILSISPEERRLVGEHQDSATAIYTALKSCHIQNKATSRYNLYDDFFSIRLNDGEKLGDMAGRLKDAMHRIKECRPSEFSID